MKKVEILSEIITKKIGRIPFQCFDWDFDNINEALKELFDNDSFDEFMKFTLFIFNFLMKLFKKQSSINISNFSDSNQKLY